MHKVKILEWIPKDIRLPSDGQEVLIVVEWSDGYRDVCAGQMVDGKWIGSWFDADQTIQEIHGDVLAWMPYPNYP